MKFSLKAKIILSVVVVIFLCGGIATFVVYNQTQDKLINLQEDNLKINTVKQAHIVKQVFNNSQQINSTISKQPELIEFLEKNSKEASQTAKINSEKINSLLNSYNIDDQYSAIYLINKNGLTLASTDTSFIGKNYGFRKYFQTAIEGEDCIDIAIGVTSNKLGYYFSHPVKNDQDKIIGVIVSKLKPEIVNNALSREEAIPQSISTEIKFILTDENGVVIYSENQEKLYHSLGQIDESKLDQLIKEKKYANYEIKPLDYGQIQNDLGIGEILKIYNLYDDNDGEQEVLVIKKLGDYPFYILSEVHLDNINNQVVEIALSLAAFVVIAALTSLLVIYIFISKFLKPLATLKENTNLIAKGNFDKKIMINSGDEIEDLNNAINNMTEELNKSKESIEEKIEQRTKQLEKTNKFMTGRELKMLELKKENTKLRVENGELKVKKKVKK